MRAEEQCVVIRSLSNLLDADDDATLRVSISESVSQHIPVAFLIQAAQLEVEAVLQEEAAQSLVCRGVELDALAFGREALKLRTEPRGTEQNGVVDPQGRQRRLRRRREDRGCI